MLEEVINGTTRAVWRLPDGSFHALNSPTAPQGPLTILSGSFNPIHDGHIELADAAEIATGRQVVFELSITNVDKPTTESAEILRRVESMSRAILISRAPTFVEKAKLVPGSCFVVGFDTAIRIVDTRYYDDSEEHLRIALQSLRSAGCEFLVSGRLMDGGYQTLKSVGIPVEFASLFTELPESAFRRDISSTELRNNS